MSADLLRRAARVARDTADAATDGPWEIDEDGDIQGRRPGMSPDPEMDPMVEVDDRESGDRAHIALWHPGVARAVAEWLEGHADAMDADGRDYVDAPAEAIARALLKGPDHG